MRKLLEQCEERAIDHALAAIGPRQFGSQGLPKDSILQAGAYASVAMMLRAKLEKE